MERKVCDFSYDFIHNVKLGLGILCDNMMTSDMQPELLGTISSSVICYYFAKTHMIVIKNALEKKYGDYGCYKRLDEGRIRGYIERALEEENFDSRDCVITNLHLTEENFNDFKECFQKIDQEFYKNLDVIQLVTRKPIIELEYEISSRKNIENYMDFSRNLSQASDYYNLKDVGIENYLENRTYQNIGDSLKSR